MNTRELSILLLRLLAIWFAGTGLSRLCRSIVHFIGLWDSSLVSEDLVVNWPALTWLTSPVIELAIAAFLWYGAAWITQWILPRHSPSDDGDVAHNTADPS